MPLHCSPSDRVYSAYPGLKNTINRKSQHLTLTVIKICILQYRIIINFYNIAQGSNNYHKLPKNIFIQILTNTLITY